MPRKPRPSLTDIAAAAGVSTMAVSYALRGSPHVSAARREKILQEARRLGYRPDPLLTQLMSHVRSRRIRHTQANLGLLVLEHDEYTNQLIAGAKARAELLGYALDKLEVAAFAGNPAGLTRMLRARGITGLLLSPCHLPQSVTGWLDWAQFSVVAMSHSIVAPVFHRVVPHHFQNALKVLTALRDLGYRRPTFAINETVRQRSNHAFTAALAWATEEWREPLVPMFVSASSPPHGLQGVGAWFRQQQPDALILTGARHIGRQLEPEIGPRATARLGLAVMSYDDAYAVPGIDQQTSLLGATAVDLLVGQIHRQERGVPLRPIVSMVEGEWVAAKSRAVGKVAPAATR